MKLWLSSILAILLLCTGAALIVQASQDQPVDNVSSTFWWQNTVNHQISVTDQKQYQGCLWGDSISSALNDSLGDDYFNFAIGGMSTVSLIEQLQRLSPNHLKCEKAIIAIGTNDAMYGISDEDFTKNLKQVIALVRSLGTQNIILIPAFYSTLAASYNPSAAGSIARVDEINVLMNQVATSENVPIESEGIQALFKDHALDENLTIDGVHLNPKGLDIYRQVLLKLLHPPSTP